MPSVSYTHLDVYKRQIPDSARVPAFIVVVASLVTIVQFLLQGYVPSLYASLGIYIPLIVVNCIILGPVSYTHLDVYKRQSRYSVQEMFQIR